MKKLISILVLSLFVALPASIVLADDLNVSIKVTQGEESAVVEAANLYVDMGGKKKQITITDEDLSFKANAKFGALRVFTFFKKKDKEVVK